MGGGGWEEFKFGTFAGEPPVHLLNRRASGSHPPGKAASSAILLPASPFHLGWLLPPSTRFWAPFPQSRRGEPKLMRAPGF